MRILLEDPKTRRRSWESLSQLEQLDGVSGRRLRIGEGHIPRALEAFEEGRLEADLDEFFEARFEA